MKTMIQNVNKRLGFDGTSNNNYNITTLSIEDIMIMYKVCVYQKGFNPDEVSTFCAVFAEEDLKVIQLTLSFEGILHMNKVFEFYLEINLSRAAVFTVRYNSFFIRL